MTATPRPVDTRTLPAVPWKNGGGTTRNLAVSPEGAGFDDFLWRISIAEVRESGPFSRFPEVDRIIVLLAGRGMTLRHADGTVYSLVEPFAPLGFRGEDSLDASLADGPTIDFNVMVRRGRAHAAVKAWESAGDLAQGGEAAMFYCARGDFEVLLPGTGEPAVRLKGESLLRVSNLGPGTRIAPVGPGSVLLSVLISYMVKATD